VTSEVKVTQTVHPDDDDGEVCDAADHATAVGWGVTTHNQFSVMNENSLW
jgi:rRNA processing protein Krr1/Pno1